MSDLDDIDLRGDDDDARQGEDQAFQNPSEPPSRPGLPGGPLVVALLVGAGVLALAVLYFFLRPKPPEPLPSADPMPLATATPVPPTPSPAIDLPPLDESDERVREWVQALSSHPEWAQWLANKHLVRTFVVVVDNIADGVAPTPHLRFLAPKEPFRAAGVRDRFFIDEATYARYDIFADIVASLDTPGSVQWYRELTPLIDDAYKDLGHVPGRFPATLDRALEALLGVSVPEGEVRLKHRAVLYTYADDRLETLRPAQKQFLRMGSRNVRLVQAKLRELHAALKAPVEAPVEEEAAAEPPVPGAPSVSP